MLPRGIPCREYSRTVQIIPTQVSAVLSGHSLGGESLDSPQLVPSLVSAIFLQRVPGLSQPLSAKVSAVMPRSFLWQEPWDFLGPCSLHLWLSDNGGPSCNALAPLAHDKQSSSQPKPPGTHSLHEGWPCTRSLLHSIKSLREVAVALNS